MAMSIHQTGHNRHQAGVDDLVGLESRLSLGQVMALPHGHDPVVLHEDVARVEHLPLGILGEYRTARYENCAHLAP